MLLIPFLSEQIGIMGCCHAGGMARKALAEGTPRTDNSDQKLPADLDQAIRDNAAVISEPRYSYVTLAACRQEEIALERRIKAKTENDGDGPLSTRGLFTVHLLTFLRKTREKCTLRQQLTYRELVDALLLESPETEKLCGAPLDGQHPLCEGLHRDRFLFRTITKTKDEMLVVKEAIDGPLYIELGRAGGVVEGTVFTIVEAPGMPSVTRGAIFLTAERVEIDRCTVSPNKTMGPEHPGSAKGAKVEVVAWTKDIIKVKAPIHIPASLGGFRFEKVLPDPKGKREKEYCDVSLDPTDQAGHWSITRFDPLVRRYHLTRSKSLISTW